MPSIAALGVAFVAVIATVASAQKVSGKPEGYGSKATGGVNGKTVTPTTTDELKAYLESSDPLTVVLSQTFDFRGTEGRTEETGCAPFGTGPSCQLAIDMNGWCGSNPSATVSYDNAAIKPIEVKSDKTIIGVGQSGVILGKGLRLSGGADNVIIQNIEISELNPHLTWGGDAIALDGSSNVWISHVTTSLVGRQHIVTGNTKNTGVTISDHFVNGTTSWSASCNSYHYWAVFMTGEFDTITFKNNYIYHVGGRAPKLGGGAVVHMANTYWDDIDGHAFEGENAYALVEGSVFRDVKTPVTADNTAAVYTPVADDAACEAALGRPCVVNSIVGSSGEFRGVDASAYSHVGKNAVDVVAASEIEGIPGTAGNTL